jgi:hypothetical protein
MCIRDRGGVAQAEGKISTVEAAIEFGRNLVKK